MNAPFPRAVTPPDADRPFAAAANRIEHSHPPRPSRLSRLGWFLLLGWVR